MRCTERDVNPVEVLFFPSGGVCAVSEATLPVGRLELPVVLLFFATGTVTPSSSSSELGEMETIPIEPIMSFCDGPVLF
ncbi:hypothetical protein AGDE_12532 [Angomonas deanei]|uniref:Uncharacterized protein n=1 Tax=Angomonas deanei TaxID=59799 RepID=A0A7G2CDJ4_9TRYP|nr:hypothetical protein AGDE_12532 [Angomonas deanei]CAD2217017.1 hypothetical protein, conserved [Angomonas deanei]|eukprot:EPY24173.1 hypothetical protein AGDE_12532 [Angomonas deanei]